MRPTPAKPILRAKTVIEAHKEGVEFYKEKYTYGQISVPCPYQYFEERELYTAWWAGFNSELKKSQILGRAMR